jgi:putative holliday junction resolvase
MTQPMEIIAIANWPGLGVVLEPADFVRSVTSVPASRIIHEAAFYNEKSVTMNTEFKGRILALDLGKRRIGIAVSDLLRVTAQGLPTLERTKIRKDLAYLAELAAEKGVAEIVLGNPIHMSGVEGRQTEYVKDFAARLGRHTGLPVKLWDERLTTVEAQRVLRQSGISIEKRARSVDRLAAVILLESYLDALAFAEAAEMPPE